MQDLIEYRVRPVTRFVVTRFERRGNDGGSEPKGEFDNDRVAYAVAYALCKEEHDRLGWPQGDKRIQYPKQRRNSVDGLDAVSQALDALAVALPNGFKWPQSLRASYEHAHRVLIGLKADNEH